MDSSRKPLRNVLLVDDDVEDAEIFQSALKEVSSSFVFTIKHSCDGIINVLDDCHPDIIFLDINIPKIDGLNCLKFIQQNETHCNIPVVMYSSSHSPKEISFAYELGATLFFTKPTSYTSLVNGLKNIILLDWSNPKVIKLQYYNEGKFQPYESVD